MSTRTRSIMLAIVGLILLAIGVVATVLLINRLNLNTQAAQQQAQVVKTNVVVLTHDMSLGDKLKESDVSLEEVPVDVVPRDAVTSLDAAVGKFIKSDMVQGEMVLDHNLANPTDNNHDITYVLSDNHVLMAFPATDLMSSEKIIKRGDIVDILATFSETVKNVGATTGTTTTTTTTNGTTTEGTPVTRDFTVDAFQKVSITAMVMNVVTDSNGNVDQSKSTVSSYLLALDPQDALVLKHLKDEGANFDLVLRAPTSTTQFDLTPVTEEYIVELYGLEILP